jgi:hypothetical protein
MRRPTITAIVFKQGRLWVAQCLEVDLCVSVESKDELPKALRRRLQSQMLIDLRHGIVPFSRFGRAPERYWKLLERAKPWVTEEVPEPLWARILRLYRHLDQAGRQLKLAQLQPS